MAVGESSNKVHTLSNDESNMDNCANGNPKIDLGKTSVNDEGNISPRRWADLVLQHPPAPQQLADSTRAADKLQKQQVHGPKQRGKAKMCVNENIDAMKQDIRGLKSTMATTNPGSDEVDRNVDGVSSYPKSKQVENREAAGTDSTNTYSQQGNIIKTRPICKITIDDIAEEIRYFENVVVCRWC